MASPLTPIDEDDESSEIYSLVELAGKGFSLIATRDIAPGTLILEEEAYMEIPLPGISVTEEIIDRAFAALPETETNNTRDLILSLHEGAVAGSSKLLRIFKSNAFGNSSRSWLHPQISRINHSCIPNAFLSRDECCLGSMSQVIAQQAIKMGEEITTCYNPFLYEISTSMQRAVMLRKQYGFACDCDACDENWLSDARRKLIGTLLEILHGLKTSDFWKVDPRDERNKGVTEEMFWTTESSDDRELLPAWKRTAFTVLLAGLRQVEGSSATAIAGDYWKAAEYMLEQIQGTNDIVIVPWAQNVRTWMEKAIGVLESVFSPYDHDPQKLRLEWKMMQEKPCMNLALACLDGKPKAPIAWSRDKDDCEPFAIQVSQNKSLLVLSQSRCNAVLEERLGTISPVSQDHEYATITQKLRDSSRLYKYFGAALTCAAPVAAYWWYR